MAHIDLRARSTSEIVDAGFALYRRNTMQYTMVTAIAYSPVLILSLLAPSARDPRTPSDLVGMLPVYLVSFFTYAIVSAVIVRMGADVYLGERADVGRTVRAVLPRVPTVLVASILSGVLILVGLAFFLLPGLYFLARYFAVSPVVILEGKGPWGALGRSRELAKGRKGHILATLLLSYGLYIVLSIGITMTATAVGSTILLMIVSTLFSIFAYPIINLVSMVLYYDVRIRAEGFDLEHMAGSMGSTGGAAAASSAVA